MGTETADVRIGISGWSYSNWKGKFYPKDLAAKDQLAYAASKFRTLELNSTFYRLSLPSTYDKWAAQMPDGFVLAVKGWRDVTHYKKLRNTNQSVAQFFRSGPLQLGSKLGPVLWQLPPSLTFDKDVLETFFASLPTTFGDALEFIGNNAPDDGRANPDIPQDQLDLPIRYSLEPRNKTFLDPAVVPLMEEYGVALVMADSAGKFPQFDQLTAPFTYVRLHGSPRLYYSNYSNEVLEQWADKIRAWRSEGVGSYVYFDNTARGAAPLNAETLIGMVG